MPLEDRGFEYMMNALRLTGGFERDSFSERTGLAWDSVADITDAAVDDGLLSLHGETIQPTQTGIRFLNDLLTRFLPD